MQFNVVSRLAAMLAAVALLAALPAAALAHERREVGEYQFVVGFIEEPALEGEPNGVSLRVTDGAGQPVEDLTSLHVQVTHIPSSASTGMELHEAFGDPGHYMAHFIPTSPGAYSFHFTGDIGGAAIDETFASGENTFDEVAAAQDVQFPVTHGSGRELESAVRGVQSSVDDAEDAASTATTMATGGLIAGLLGLAAGVTGLGVALVTRRQR